MYKAAAVIGNRDRKQKQSMCYIWPVTTGTGVPV